MGLETVKVMVNLFHFALTGVHNIGIQTVYTLTSYKRLIFFINEIFSWFKSSIYFTFTNIMYTTLSIHFSLRVTL